MTELSPSINATLTDTYHAAEARNAPSQIAVPELPKDATTQERAEFDNRRERQLDADLMWAYNKVHATEARELARHPPLPTRHYVEGTSQDQKIDATMRAALDWQELPATERRVQAASAEQIALAKKIAQELGMPAENAADVLAVLDKINGVSKQAAPAQPDPEAQAAFAAVKYIVPQARNMQEAITEIGRWQQRIEQNPREWGTLLRERYNISPMNLLTQQEAAQVALAFYGIPAGRVVDLAQAPHFVPETRTRLMIDDFAASKPDWTPQLRQKMAELIQGGKIQRDGWQGLEDAYQEARRYASTAVRRVEVEDTLSAVARRAYG